MSHDPTDHAIDHVSRAKDPKMVHESQGILRLIGTIFFLATLAITVWGFVSWAKTKMDKMEADRVTARLAALERARTNPPPASTVATRALPSVIRTNTPATLSVDYDFYIESGGKPIKVTYSNGRSFICNTGSPQKFPVPSWGPKTFEDPDNSTNQILFRIYPDR